MALSGEEITRRRHLVRVLLRGLCFLGLLSAAVILLRVLVLSVLWQPQRVFSGQFSWDPSLARTFALAFAIAIPAGVLLLAEGRIARWLVPVPRPECPRCGYGIEQLSTPRCPECGLPLRGE